MKREKTGLAKLVEGVERWRRERAHVKARAPEELWDAAVEVALKEGVYATAKAIRFDSSRLKARMSGAPRPAPKASRNDGASFVAIEVPALEARATSAETVVDFVGHQGERMRIVAAAGALDVLGLAQAFWSRAS